jgi:hypothetical protein
MIPITPIFADYNMFSNKLRMTMCAFLVIGIEIASVIVITNEQK